MNTYQETQQLLNQRSNTHGDFIQNGMIMQDLKDLVRTHDGWNDLQSYQREAIEMICHKLGRILCGNPNFYDHWADIAGYAKLVENILTTGKSHISETSTTLNHTEC